MAFADELRDFASRLDRLRENITTEEATKTSTVLPFFQLLGYDVFNPLEFIPEYTADTGMKKGEKVDYAILQNGDPIMIVEVKPINTALNAKHINQLFRYFTVTKTRFAILTNGIVYRFYSDLEEPNKMDMTPFLEIDLTNLKSDTVNELKKFQRENFDVKGIIDTASELKYTLLLKNAIAEQFSNPSDQFVRALIKNIYTGVKTQSVMDRFRELTLTAIDNYINDLLNDKLKTIISPDAIGDPSNDTEPSIGKELEFRPEELETLEYVKRLIGVDDVAFKKVTNYAYMYINGAPGKWICRVSVRQDKRLLTLHKFDTMDCETEYYFDDPELLGQLEVLIREVYINCKKM